jgi:PAS domain S-box-containing protein
MINIARRFSTMADKIRKREQSLQREVRDRKHAEKKSRENEARTKAILDAIPDVIFQSDQKGRFLDVRGEVEELLTPAEKIIGCRLERVMPSKISRVFHRQLDATFENRSVRVFEYQLPSNNAIRHFECRLVAVSDQLAIGIVRDITSQVTAAELVIDDIQEQRQIATDMLTRLGYAVESVDSGEAAIDHVRRQSVDLLLLDMIMEPGIDGLETYRRIIDVFPGQWAVITSGFSESERVQETRRLGASGYIKKTLPLRAPCQGC